MPADRLPGRTAYLAGHNRRTHEALFSNDENIAGESQQAFVGMAGVECYLETLLETRDRLQRELPRRLRARHKQFLSGLTRARPDWYSLRCAHAEQLPALRWKLRNLETFRKRRPTAYTAQAEVGKIIGRDRSTLQRYGVDPKSHNGELALRSPNQERILILVPTEGLLRALTRACPSG